MNYMSECKNNTKSAVITQDVKQENVTGRGDVEKGSSQEVRKSEVGGYISLSRQRGEVE